MFKEFKEFIARGNVMDMAVGIIVGSAFTSIVKSLVSNIINPLIGIFTGKIDFSSVMITIGSAHFRIGTFLNSIINFLIISFVVFLMVKFVNTVTHRKKKEKVDPEVQYLKEIITLLKQQENNGTLTPQTTQNSVSQSTITKETKEAPQNK